MRNNIREQIMLETNEPMKQLVFQGEYAVDELYFTCTLSVVSEAFRGESLVCYPRRELSLWYEALQSMYDSLSCTAELHDHDSDGFVKFEMRDSGSVEVTGQVGGTYEDHYMRRSPLYY